jgi:hypothetical protein
MILLLRGHIRGSFDTTDLYDLIKVIYLLFPDLKIVIHTWNIVANNCSWREIETDVREVTPNTILDYFKDLTNVIKVILIDDDTKINLIGKVEGTINGGLMKLIGWKNYWYGKYKIIDYIHDKIDQDEVIINFRFDIMNNSNSLSLFTIIRFIINHCTATKNTFLYNEEHNGIDNIYIGNSVSMYKLSYLFHHHLDTILLNHTDIKNHERLVFRINKLCKF